MTQPLPGAFRFRVQRLLTAEQALPFRAMTYPAYVPLLDQLVEESSTLAIGAFSEQGEPIGLGLVQADSPEVAQFLSVLVVEDYQQQGVGSALLQALEAGCREARIPHVYLVYPGGKPVSAVVERMLRRHGWQEPKPRMTIFHVTRQDSATIEKAPWFHHARLPEGFASFPWGELTPEERERIGEWLAIGVVPAMLSPFNEEYRVDLAVSLGIRRNGQLCGWVVCHRLSEQTLRYTSQFIHPDVPALGLGFALCIQVLRRHLAQTAHLEVAEASWAVVAGHPLIPFYQRRLAPHLPTLKMTTTMESHKLLLP